MCGIAGFVHRDPSRPADEPTLVAMRETLVHRGPDDAGHYVGSGVGLASRRLAIVDLSQRGRMPMSTPDGRYAIVHNGEVYNYRQLRAALTARGHAFRSNTDTEVLLHLYADEGPAMLPRLNGMFALAVLDRQTRTLFLARDRLGVKPLYYACEGGSLYFASEQKALFAAGLPARFDPTTWKELLCFRYVAGERTPLEGVKRLLPGHYLTWRDGEIRVRRWWHLADRARTLQEEPPADPEAWLRELFDSAIAFRRISDVPLGVLLSGGLDSSSVAASLALQAGSGVASFTVRFTEPTYDEGPVARTVAARWGLDHHELMVSPAELVERLREAAWLSDEPLAHGSNLHILAISRYAKSRVTVLLSGEGADEVLGGYVRYRPLRHPAWLSAARQLLSRAAGWGRLPGRVRKLARFLRGGSLDRFVLFNACDVLPEDLTRLGMRPEGHHAYRETVLEEARTLYPGEPVRQAMYSDLHTFLCSLLDRNDRMTMGASIECRVPFLDYRLVEGLAALPSRTLFAGGGSKPLLRRTMRDRLPPEVLRHRKWGFAVPWGRYFRAVTDLRAFVDALPDLEIVRNGPFDRAQVPLLLAEFLAGDDRHEALVTQLVMIALWHETYFARVGPPRGTEATSPTPLSGRR